MANEYRGQEGAGGQGSGKGDERVQARAPPHRPLARLALPWRPAGWLGLLLGSRLYFNMVGEALLDEARCVALEIPVLSLRNTQLASNTPAPTRNG